LYVRSKEEIKAHHTLGFTIGIPLCGIMRNCAELKGLQLRARK